MKSTFAFFLFLFVVNANAQINIVKNIKAGSLGSKPLPLSTLPNGNLLFFADDGVNGNELWITDGTTGNTSMLIDINPGATGSFSTVANVVAGDKIFFTANDGTSGHELWVTDGTVAGTRMLKDINPGRSNGMPGGRDTFYNVTRILLEGQSNAFGLGTQDSLNYPPISNIPFNFRKKFDRVFISDSTGTYKNLQLGVNNQGFGGVMFGPEIGIAWQWELNNPTGLLFIDKQYIDGGPINSFLNTAAYRTFYLAKRDSSNRWLKARGYIPMEAGWFWVQGEGNYAVTAAFYKRKLDSVYQQRLALGMIKYYTKPIMSRIGTSSIGYGSGVDSAFTNFVSTNKYASALNNNGATYNADMVHYSSYWYLQLGSNAYAKIFDTDDFSDNLAVLNGKIYFNANDGVNGNELWSTDGTQAGTQIVKDINTAASMGSNPQCLQIALGKLFFIAGDGINGNEWWSSDGTTTKLLSDINPGTLNGASSDAGAFVTYNGMGYFVGATIAQGSELYTTDGTTVSILKDINVGSGSSTPSNLMVAGGKLYFSASEPAIGNELYVTDGTPSGTTLVNNIEVGSASSSPALIGELGSKLLFSASTLAQGRELWTSDGTTIGTQMLIDINSGAGNGLETILSEVYTKPGSNIITNPYLSGSKYYFAGNDGTNETELWVTDGTAPGTLMIPGQIGVNPSNTVSSGLDWIYIGNNKVWLRANDGNTGMELFTYDIPVINVSKLYSSNRFSITPNPNNGNFTIMLDNDHSKNGIVTVHDMMGRVIKSEALTSQVHTVNLLGVVKGVYNVSLILDGKRSIQRIVVQ